MRKTNGVKADQGRVCFDKIGLSSERKSAKRPAMRLGRLTFWITSILVVTGISTPSAAEPAQGVSLDHEIATNTWRDNLRDWSLAVARKAQNAYSRDLIAKGIEGRVVVQFRIETDGTVRDCETIRSSGSTELDALVCIAIAKTGPAPPHVNEEGVAEAKTAQLPVRFVLSETLPRPE